jgi:hypothetical protein
MLILLGVQSGTSHQQVTVFRDDAVMNAHQTFSVGPAGYGTSLPPHHERGAQKYWASSALTKLCKRAGGLPEIVETALALAQESNLATEKTVDVANAQTAGLVPIIASHSTYSFRGKGWQEYLTMHTCGSYVALYEDDAPLAPSCTTLIEQISTCMDQPKIIELSDGTICLSEFNASDLRLLGDKFLNRWRQLAEEQAKLGLNPLHLLSGITRDYYAVLLVCAGLASIPVSMSLTASGVSHIVHTVPGDADITDGMMLHDAYLPLEGHYFKRHVQMLRDTTLIDFNYRQSLPFLRRLTLRYPQPRNSRP